MKKYNFKNFKEAYSFARQAKTAPEFPPYVTFELTSHCNFKCIMCPHTYMERKQRHMDFNLFKKAVDEIAEYGSAVRFIGLSEPFLHPQIIEAMEYVKSKGLLLHITTNASVINTGHIERILDLGLDSIIFSMQGLTKQEYSFMRGCADYDTVVSNIKKLHSMRAGSLKPYMKMTTTITERDDAGGIELFKQEHSKYCDEVQITGTTCFTRIEKDYAKRGIHEKLGIKQPKRLEKIRCRAPYYELLVNANGRVSPCCSDSDEVFVIGDIALQSLRQMWDSQLLKAIRKVLDEGKTSLLSNCINCVINYEANHYKTLAGSK